VLEEALRLRRRLEVGHVLELFERDRAFGLEADIEDDEVLANLKTRDFTISPSSMEASVPLYSSIIARTRRT
jgi:hypothetical protein